jgi:hypothetical protein
VTPILEPRQSTPSASGKTLAVASTHGNAPAGAKVNGHDVIGGVNAYFMR